MEIHPEVLSSGPAGGGSWHSTVRGCKAGARDGYPSNYANVYEGFRVALDILKSQR